MKTLMSSDLVLKSTEEHSTEQCIFSWPYNIIICPTKCKGTLIRWLMYKHITGEKIQLHAHCRVPDLPVYCTRKNMMFQDHLDLYSRWI